MNLNELLERVLLSFGSVEITLRNLILGIVIVLLILLARQLLLSRYYPRFMKQRETDEDTRKKLRRQLNLCLLTLAVMGLLLALGLDYTLYSDEHITFKISSVLGTILVLQLARITDLLLGNVILKDYLEANIKEERRPGAGVYSSAQKESRAARRYVRYFAYALAALFIIRVLDVNYTLQTFSLKGGGTFSLTVSKVVIAGLIFFLTRLLIWLATHFFLGNMYKQRDINIGSQYAINQLFKYITYFLALLIILQVLGVSITLVASGAAALLLGVGLGLQQTFNDFFSGILLLFERSVEVGDVVNIDGTIGKVSRIGLRASEVQTRDNLTLLVPNSNLVVNKITNWSHNDEVARFTVSVGVAYGSDTKLVKKQLLEAARAHNKILKFPTPFVRFANFGDSSLDFELHFWSLEFMRIEDVKSDLRFDIDLRFREHHIEIPFPQRDVWIKKPD